MMPSEVMSTTSSMEAVTESTKLNIFLASSSGTSGWGRLFWPKVEETIAAQPAPVPSAVATTSALSQRLRHESSMSRISRSWLSRAEVRRACSAREAHAACRCCSTTILKSSSTSSAPKARRAAEEESSSRSRAASTASASVCSSRTASLRSKICSSNEGLSDFLVRMPRTSSMPFCTIVRSVHARTSAHPMATLSSASTMSNGKQASASSADSTASRSVRTSDSMSSGPSRSVVELRFSVSCDIMSDPLRSMCPPPSSMRSPPSNPARLRVDGDDGSRPSRRMPLRRATGGKPPPSAVLASLPPPPPPPSSSSSPERFRGATSSTQLPNTTARRLAKSTQGSELEVGPGPRPRSGPAPRPAPQGEPCEADRLAPRHEAHAEVETLEARVEVAQVGRTWAWVEMAQVRRTQGWHRAGRGVAVVRRHVRIDLLPHGAVRCVSE
eukprot:scaffold96741_cov64-Phaeocystis_antarctica.AAC.3